MTRHRNDASRSYALEVARLLWPEPWGAPEFAGRRARPGSGDRQAYVVPSVRRPRLLVPVDVPGASTMVQRLGAGRGVVAATALALVERRVRSSARGPVRWPVISVRESDVRVGADSIEDHLADAFGTEVRVGIFLGTRRVNQKPVLQVFARDGRLLGFAKIGHNDLTAALVRHEASALATLAGSRLRSIDVPSVVRHDQWHGLQVLAISPVVTSPRRSVGPAVRVAAMNEVAQVGGVIEIPLSSSSFWTRLRSDVARLAAAPGGDRLLAAADAVERLHGTELVQLGGWHGDWGRWNMGLSPNGDVLGLWDWERYDPTVPLGFDALHYAAQSVRPGEREHHTQEERFLRTVPELVSEVGVERSRAALTLRLYLLEIAARYVGSLTFGTTPALARRASWTVSLLEQQLTVSHPALVEGLS